MTEPIANRNAESKTKEKTRNVSQMLREGILKITFEALHREANNNQKLLNIARKKDAVLPDFRTD